MTQTWSMRKIIPGICLCILASAITETSAQEGASSSILTPSNSRQSGAVKDSTAAATVEQKNLAADELSASDVRPETGTPDPGGSSEDRRTSLPDTLLPDRPFGTPPPVEMKPFDYKTFNPNDYILTAVKVTTPIKLDGRLDDDAWKLARPASRFYQLEPKEGFPASQPTEVRVLYDTENLYIGFMCYDSEPAKIVAREFKRDGQLHGSNDYVVAIIAPFDGGRESYEFMMNPNGARRDLFVSQEGSNFDQDWNGNWNAASVRHSQGWSAEMAIPFRALRFPSNSVQTWNINFGRFLQRTRESAYWVPVSQQDGFRGAYKFAKGGRLTGLRNIKPGGMMEVLPFTVLGPTGTRQVVGGPTASIPIAQTDFQYGLQRRFGGDLKWRVRSGLTADATVNPDFAQIEADDQVVNLSRFEFRFDEKRPFFLERSDIFNLGRSGGGGMGGGGGRGGGGGGRGGGGGVPQLFFSRRIGRQLPDGASVPIDLGLRLTGKLNKTTIGYLNVQSREVGYIDYGIADTTQVEPETNWQAFRIQQDILSRSSIGLLATFREPEGQPDNTSSIPVPRFASRNYNRVLGMDAAFASSRGQHELQFMMAKSWTDTLQASRSDWVWRVGQNWQNRWMSYDISYLDIGSNFLAQTGFVTRTNIRRVGGFVSLNPLIRQYGIRRIRPSVRGEYIANRQQRFFDPATWEISPSLSFELEGGDFISLGGGRSFDTLTETTQIAGVHFRAGEYTYDQATFSVFTNSARRLSGNVFSTIGEFYGGRLMSVSGEAQYRPVDRLLLSLGLTETRLKRPNRVGLASTEYDYNHTRIPRIRFSYSFTPNLFVTSLVQLNANKRRPGDDFHLNTVTSNFLIAYRSPFGHSFFLAFNQLSDDALSTTTTFGPYDRTPLRLRDRTIVAKMAYLFNM